jgi:hypothetical protein
VVENSTARLTASERRVGAALLAEPHQIAGMTASQLARHVGVHESTVVRFAQKVGYPGFRQLREDLARDGAADIQERPRLAGKASASSLADVAATQIEAIAMLPGLISQESLDAAAESLLEARRVVVLGTGVLDPIATFTERKLRLLGMDTVLVRGSGSDLLERLAATTADDAVLAFAYAEQFESLSLLLPPLGIVERSVLVSDQAALLSSRLPGHVLVLPRAEVRHGVSVVALVVAYALEYALFRLAPEGAERAEQRLASMRRSQQTDGL